MTMIAGFRSYEGVVLCADTQETVEHAKRSIPKLRFEPRISEWEEEHFSNLAAAFCGAGDGPFTDKLVEEAWKASKNASDLDAACDAIELSIKNQYQEFGAIFQPGYCPQAQLIFGVKMNGRSRLFSACGPVVNEKQGYDSGGVGHYIADFLAARMYGSHLSVCQCVILAAYALFQAKEHVEGCGGDSHIAVLRDDGASGIVDWKRIQTITELLRSADHETGDLLLRSADLNLHDQDLKQTFDHARELLEFFRKNAVDEIKRWDGLPTIMLAGSKPRDSLGLPLPSDDPTLESE